MNGLDAKIFGYDFFWSIDRSVENINKLINYVFTWRNEFRGFIDQFPDRGQHTGDLWIDAIANETYIDVACSHVVVATIAPLIETLFYRAFTTIGKNATGLIRPKHIRWDTKESDKHWDPRYHYDEKKQGWQTSFLYGHRQLLNAVQCKNISPNHIVPLFSFRNQALHWGYEWPKREHDKFVKRIHNEKWNNKFCFGNEPPWIITLTDTFVQEIINQIIPIARKLFLLQERLNSHLISDHVLLDAETGSPGIGGSPSNAENTNISL